MDVHTAERPTGPSKRTTCRRCHEAGGSCNASKSNDEVTSWMRRKRLDERAFLLRHAEIQMALVAHAVAEPAE